MIHKHRSGQDCILLLCYLLQSDDGVLWDHDYNDRCDIPVFSISRISIVIGRGVMKCLQAEAMDVKE